MPRELRVRVPRIHAPAMCTCVYVCFLLFHFSLNFCVTRASGKMFAKIWKLFFELLFECQNATPLFPGLKASSLLFSPFQTSFEYRENAPIKIFILIYPLYFIFIIRLLIDLNRIPFDLIEGESELVSGFNLE